MKLLTIISKFIAVISLLLMISCSSISMNKAQNVSDSGIYDALDNDSITYLKGGYYVVFGTDDENQFLMLTKNGNLIKTLNTADKNMLRKNLGYVICDFDKHFLIGQSFSSGNPHPIRLIKKNNGKNIFKQSAFYIDVDLTKQVILFSENDVPTENDKMSLYDIKKNRFERYDFPEEIFGEAEKLNRINLLETTDHYLIIEYLYNDWSHKKQKKYLR